MSVVAALALAGCDKPSPELDPGSTQPSYEFVQPNIEDQSLERNDGDFVVSPKPAPPKPVECDRSHNWPTHHGRDDEFSMTDFQPDGTSYPFDCYKEDWIPVAELPNTSSTGIGIWVTPQYESPGCDTRSDEDADAGIACSPLTDGLMLGEAEINTEDEEQLQFELKIYEGEEIGHVDLIWPEDFGAVIEWSIPFSH